jgi:hypothetical protein
LEKHNQADEQNQTVAAASQAAESTASATSEAAPKAAEAAQPPSAQTTLPESEPAVDTAERKQQALNTLEAALYVAGRPLDINELSSCWQPQQETRHRLR